MASGGNIVNLASTAAHAGQPWAAAYAAVQGRRAGHDPSARRRVRQRRASGPTAISPGAIDTPITQAFHLPEGADTKLIHRVTPLGRFGTPEGIAAAIAYVASDEASHMNGADILIDGATLA